MKIQDVVLIAITVVLFIRPKVKWFVTATLVSFLLSIPLFYLKVALFTAQHLVYFASFWMFLAFAGSLRSLSKTKSEL